MEDRCDDTRGECEGLNAIDSRSRRRGSGGPSIFVWLHTSPFVLEIQTPPHQPDVALNSHHECQSFPPHESSLINAEMPVESPQDADRESSRVAERPQTLTDLREGV